MYVYLPKKYQLLTFPLMKKQNLQIDKRKVSQRRIIKSKTRKEEIEKI